MIVFNLRVQPDFASFWQIWKKILSFFDFPVVVVSPLRDEVAAGLPFLGVGWVWGMLGGPSLCRRSNVQDGS